MRIGIIAPPWLPVPPRRYGGTENMIDGLARGLAAQGQDVTLVACMGSRCRGVPTIPLRVSCPPSDMGHAVVEVPYALRAYAALAQADVDVIHDHTQTGFLTAHTDRPVVTTNHNPFDAERAEIYTEAARRGVRVVAISKHHAGTAERAAITVAGVVHNGIDAAAVPVGKGDGGYACVLSRMSPTKGIREAILTARDAGMPLFIAAKMQTSQERAYFDDQVRPMLNGRAEYLGEVSAAEKYELLGRAVALLNPIQWAEPFGLSMIEALACGTPVLSTLMGSAPEIIAHGETGWLRAHWSMMGSDLENVADTIDRGTCRQVAEERFGIARMATAYLDLYQQHSTKQENAA